MPYLSTNRSFSMTKEILAEAFTFFAVFKQNKVLVIEENAEVII